MARAEWFDPRSPDPSEKASENVRDPITPPGDALGVVIDGGTTNTRARLVHHGKIVGLAARSVGVRDTGGAGGATPLTRAVRGCIDDVLRETRGERPDFIVAAGMLSSDAGLCTVPHVVAPAGRDDLARGTVQKSFPEISPQPILFIPGVRTQPPSPEAWDEADVMRGEEAETLGAWEALEPRGPSLFLWPGSHTKLVAVDGDGRISRSFTSLAGELLSAVAKHTLIARSLPETLPDDPDASAVAEGERLARRGLGRAAFLIRLAELTGRYDSHRRASLWLGAVVADDVAHLASHAMMEGGAPVWVGGRQPLRGLYAAQLAKVVSVPVVALDNDLAERASALGALSVASRRWQLDRQDPSSAAESAP